MSAPFYKKSFWLPVALALLLLAVAFGPVLYYEGREARLLAQYSADPDKKIFAEFLKKDYEDLASNPERARRIGITMDIGLQWYNLRHPDSASRWWRKGLDIEPKNSIGWYNLANAYREQRRFSSAAQAYRNSMKYASQGEVDACIALGEMYRYNLPLLKEKEDNVYFECLKKQTGEDKKGDRNLIARLAIYYRDNGDLQNALLYFDKLYSIEPSEDVSIELRKIRLKLDEEKQKK